MPRNVPKIWYVRIHRETQRTKVMRLTRSELGYPPRQPQDIIDGWNAQTASMWGYKLVEPEQKEEEHVGE